MSDETKARVNAWAAECFDYWAQFDPQARITEDMIEAQPQPPDDIVFDAVALINHALACLVHQARTGEQTRNPSVESRLLTSELIDRGVEAALAQVDPQVRRQETHRLWDLLMEGGEI